MEKLTQICKFEAVDPNQNKEQYMRDTFINGISFANIRQRLLVNQELSQADAFQQTRTLELTQKQYSSFDSYSIATIEPLPLTNRLVLPLKRNPRMASNVTAATKSMP